MPNEQNGNAPSPAPSPIPFPEKEIADKPPASSSAADHCPHQEIIALYHRLLPMGRRVRVWSDARKAKLRARWREDAGRQDIEWWEDLFAYIAKSNFLTGKVRSNGRRPFEIDLEWIVTESNLIKIIEGKYEEEAAA